MKVFKLVASLVLGAFVLLPAHGQLVHLPLDGSAIDASLNAVQVDAQGIVWTNDGGRSFARLPEDSGMVIIPQSVSEQLGDAYDFEVNITFRLTQRTDKLDFRNLLSLRAHCEERAFRCPGLGIGFFNNDPAQDPFIILNFVDGKRDQVPDHPANNFDDNVRWLQRVPQDEWIQVSLIVDFEGDAYRIVINDTVHEGTINNPDRPEYTYDVDAISSAVTSNPMFLGGWRTDETGRSVLPMDLDEVSVYAPSRYQEAEIRTALSELTADITGAQSLTDEQKETHFRLLELELPRVIDAIRPEVMAFLTAYETTHPPLFESAERVRRQSLSWEDQAVILLQTHIKNEDFVNGRLDLVEGLSFEAAEVFPGVIDPDEPRISAAEVSWNATYELNPRIILTASDFVVRPSGYWAPAGEIIRIDMPQEAVDAGVSLLVGAHFRTITDDLETQNRFQDIGTEFPVNRTDMQVANPFGGGIYLKVPEGTTLGTINATIHDAVKSAYYSHRNGVQSDVGDWTTTVSSTSVPWVDLESDRFMTTLPLGAAREVDNPDEIMEQWDRIYGEHNALAGRTEPNGRAEFYIVDRQLVTPAFGAGYPVTVSMGGFNYSASEDLGHDEQWGTWNPLRVLQFRPQFIFMHEMGHNLLLPEFLYPDGGSFTSESSVHIWASKIYDTLYGMDRDEAFRMSAYQQMTMDLAAMDRMLTYNFRNDLPMGHDPTMDPSINDEIRYQHRGHGPIVDFAWLFGWDALGEVYGMFYDGTFPPVRSDGWTHVRSRDQLVEASSIVTGVDTSPFWYFWGWYASEELRVDLASRFPQSPAIRDRIEYYRSLIPEDAAGYAPWHEQFMALNDDVHSDRWTSYRDTYESNVRDEVLAQFDRIFSMAIDSEDVSELPQRTMLRPAYPNPFIGTVRIPFTLVETGSVRLEVIDVLGRRVAVLVDDLLPAGSHEATWSTAAPAGMYAVRMHHAGGTFTQMVIHRR